jgi:hypothetical protein
MRGINQGNLKVVDALLKAVLLERRQTNQSGLSLSSDGRDKSTLRKLKVWELAPSWSSPSAYQIYRDAGTVCSGGLEGLVQHCNMT